MVTSDGLPPVLPKQAETVVLPKNPPIAWFRPFINCPEDEVRLAWEAFLRIAEKLAAMTLRPTLKWSA